MYKQHIKKKSTKLPLDNNSIILKKLLGDFDEYQYSIDVGKYKKDYVRMAETACSLGADDKKLAELFAVHIGTIKIWRKTYSEFGRAIVVGMDQYNVGVLEGALIRRAEGIKVEEVITDHMGFVKTKIKELPPNIDAIKFALKNRAKDRWKESSEVNTTVSHNLDLTKLNTSQIENLIDLLQSANPSEKSIECEVIKKD